MPHPAHFDPELDLWLEREAQVAPAEVWRGWTEPEQLMKWFCPRPWKTTACRIDLRVGGAFVTQMESPQGEPMPANEGCLLALEPERRLVFTDALGADFRPNAEPFMTAEIQMLPRNGGTHYCVHVRHASAAARTQHAEMGFESGWGAAWEQLVELIESGFA